MTDALLREVFVLRRAWDQLVYHVTTADPREADPHDVFGSAYAADRDRLVALLYAHSIGADMTESERVLAEVMALAREGKRPRDGSALGLERAA